MITTVMLWICIVITLLSSIFSFIYSFTKKTTNERVAYFISFLYQCSLLYFLIGLI